MKRLQFKEGGVFLDDERLNHVTSFAVFSLVEDGEQFSRITVNGMVIDECGNFIANENGDYETYTICEKVVVVGLDDQEKQLSFKKEVQSNGK